MSLKAVKLTDKFFISAQMTISLLQTIVFRSCSNGTKFATDNSFSVVFYGSKFVTDNRLSVVVNL